MFGKLNKQIAQISFSLCNFLCPTRIFYLFKTFVELLAMSLMILKMLKILLPHSIEHYKILAYSQPGNCETQWISALKWQKNPAALSTWEP